MNLSRKIFLYSGTISCIIVGFMISYFILMLPSLYVDYVSKENLNSIKEVQEIYIKEGSYKNISPKNPMATVTIKIPNEGNNIIIANKLKSFKVTLKDNELIDILNRYRYYLNNVEDIEESNFNVEDVLEVLKSKFEYNNTLIDFEVLESDDYKNFKGEYSKTHIISDNFVIIEAGIYQGGSYYTNYIAMTINNEDIVISYLPVITPQIGEIRPIVFQSLPMIFAVSVLIILISTIIYSRTIVNPIEMLVNQAVYIRENINKDIEGIKIEGNDEIATLGETLNDLYFKLRDNFKELENKNNDLKQQNKKQEVFLRASSHQLKTPVAASMLLIDGMINEIGKYKDTKTYLPQVKEQLLSMRKIIDNILSLNNSNDFIEENIDIKELIDGCLISHNIQISKSNLSIKSNVNNYILKSDKNLMFKVIDNLISNAIKYSKENGVIDIEIKEDTLSIKNYGVLIDEEVLQNIFEPFVCGNNKEKGHGLGLYIVSYYTKLLNYNVEIINIENGVEAKIIFNK